MSADQRVLTREGELISLPPKATDILLVLLRRAGELVEKEDLMHEVWPDSFVEEGNLTQNIFTLRRALGDHRTEAEYIETVVRRGYRFIAAVRKLERASAFPHAESERIFPPILAVLPFENSTGNNDLDYLAEGIYENILNTLSQITKLRVMSRSAIFRYRDQEFDPKSISSEMRIDAFLHGRIVRRPTGLVVSAELVDAPNSWLLWGASFECESIDILEIQEEIVCQVLDGLRLKLSGEETKRVTARYTESSRAYQKYIEGRFHWGRYTRAEIDKAIVHFQEAIKLDPNYALAYAGIVDCYLRLVTNYIPPDGLAILNSESTNSISKESTTHNAEDSLEPFDTTSVKLRHEWDWRNAERELRRANELKSDYPAAHQWNAAYLLVRKLYENQRSSNESSSSQNVVDRKPKIFNLPISLHQLTPTEDIQVFCAIARDQIDIGNYEAASFLLKRWWQIGTWPRLKGLDTRSCADLLFTTGVLAGFLASARQLPTGQTNAEMLLSGSIALFEQIGSAVRTAEGQMELGLCYYRQGQFDLSRSTFLGVLETLSDDDCELRCLLLIRLASLERHASRLEAALSHLESAKADVNKHGPWITGRFNLELASTYKELGCLESDHSYLQRALTHYLDSLGEFQAIGNFRMLAIAQNNIGFLLLFLDRFDAAHFHLQRARNIFESFQDRVKTAQVDDTLAHLYLAKNSLDSAESAASRAMNSLLIGDEDVLLAEVLSTKGIVSARLGRYREAERFLEWAYGVALRCGDRERAGRASLIMIEEIKENLSSEAGSDVILRLEDYALKTQQNSIRLRVQKAIDKWRSIDRNRS